MNRRNSLPGGGLRVTRAKNALLEMQRDDGAWSASRAARRRSRNTRP